MPRERKRYIRYEKERIRKIDAVVSAKDQEEWMISITAIKSKPSSFIKEG
jgi:hypothetical protein